MVSHKRLPLNISFGITFPSSATMVYSHVLVLPGITNPNSKKRLSMSCPFRYMFYANVIFSIGSAEENVIILAIDLADNISPGK
jgi:hypothetical protein|tara:strand:- start:318 stop:569 length:252 start_codon:yes stop_codon:yes gene_type:complete